MAVVVLYAVLWLPMNVFQLCLNLLCYQNTRHQSFCHSPRLIQLLYIAAHFLTVSNTAINPIIYGFTNNCFRVRRTCLRGNLLMVFPFQSDLRQLRRRLFHCQGQPPFYFQARFGRQAPQVLEDRLHYVNVKASPITPADQRTQRLQTTKRSSALFEPNKGQRTAFTTVSAFSEKDHVVTKQRHTT